MRGRACAARVFAHISQGADSDAALVLESCVDAVAAGDGRELWVMQPGGRIAALLRGEKCISEHDGLVSLSDCEGGVAWELQANNQLKSASAGGLCLSGSGASSGTNVALRAAVHASSAIDVAHGASRRWLELLFVRSLACMLVLAGAVMAVDGADATYCPSPLPARRIKASLQLVGVTSGGPPIPQGHLVL